MLCLLDDGCSPVGAMLTTLQILEEGKAFELGEFSWPLLLSSLLRCRMPGMGCPGAVGRMLDSIGGAMVTAR